MTALIPFGFMIFYAICLLLIAKPLDRWREARLAAKARVPEQRKLFGDFPSPESGKSLITAGHK
ncbi:MAG: hypothetical protein WB949_12965 [Candidatus Acidiferrales bacterium]